MMPKLDHTPHTMKHIVEPVIVSLITNIMSRINYRFVKWQNGSAPYEHVAQRFHTIWSEAQPTFVHLTTFIRKNCFSHLNHVGQCTTWSCSLGVNSIKISLACKYAMTSAFSYMSKTPSPSSSISKSWESSLPMLLWNTSFERPNKIDK